MEDKFDSVESQLEKKQLINNFLEEGIVKKINCNYINRDSHRQVDYKRQGDRTRQLVKDGVIGREEFLALPEIYLQAFEHIAKTALYANKLELPIFVWIKGVGMFDYIQSCSSLLRCLIDEYHMHHYPHRGYQSILFDICRVMVDLPEKEERELLKKQFSVLTLFVDFPKEAENGTITGDPNYPEVRKEDVEEIIEYRNKFVAEFESRQEEVFKQYSGFDDSQ